MELCSIPEFKQSSVRSKRHYSYSRQKHLDEARLDQKVWFYGCIVSRSRVTQMTQRIDKPRLGIFAMSLRVGEDV